MKLKLAWLREWLLAPARQIRWKIIAPYVILTLVLAAGGTFLATRMVTGSLEERFENQLAEAARVTSDAVVRREREHLELVRGIAFTEGVAAAIRDQNESALARLIAHHKSRIFIPLALALVDKLGFAGLRVLHLRGVLYGSLVRVLARRRHRARLALARLRDLGLRLGLGGTNHAEARSPEGHGRQLEPLPPLPHVGDLLCDDVRRIVASPAELLVRVDLDAEADIVLADSDVALGAPVDGDDVQAGSRQVASDLALET